MKKKKWIAAAAVLLFIAAVAVFFGSTGKTSLQEAESQSASAEEAGSAGRGPPAAVPIWFQKTDEISMKIS